MKRCEYHSAELEHFFESESVRRAKLFDRFMQRVQPSSGDSECSIWVGPRRGVHGVFHVARGVAINAHRAAWLFAFGKLPDGYVCHRCNEPLCVNPEHLFLASQKEHLAHLTLRRHQNESGNAPANGVEKVEIKGNG